MASGYMKGCSALLIIREMQIKTTMRYHLKPVRMAIVKKHANSKSQKGCGEKLVPFKAIMISHPVSIYLMHHETNICFLLGVENINKWVD